MSFREDFNRASVLPSNTSSKFRLRHALLFTGHESTWERIEACCKNRRCGSYYCDSCRVSACKHQADVVLSHHLRLHNGDDSLARRNIQSVTVLHELVAPGHKNGGRYNDFSEVDRSIRSLRRKLQRIRKKFPGLLMFGRIELEIVNTRSIITSGQCVRKASVMKLLTVDKGCDQDDMVLVHVHFLMFLNGYCLKKVKSYLVDRFPGKYMVHITSTYKTETTEHNITTLCRYYAKGRYSYNNKMDTDGYKTGRLLNNNVLSYGVRLHMYVGYSGLVLWCKR